MQYQAQNDPFGRGDLMGRPYPVVNRLALGWAAPRAWPCGHAHPELAGTDPSLGYGHPPPPGVCCQATPDGGTICSDGFIGPKG